MSTLFAKHLVTFILKGLIFTIPFFYISCTDDENNIGTDLLEDNLVLSKHIDSSTNISLQTQYDTTIRSSRFAYMVGAYTDPVTGSHKAGFMSRFYIDSTHYDIANYTLDSICFKMYDTSYYYGNHTKEQTIHIAELQEDLTLDTYIAYNEQGKVPESIITSATEIATHPYIPQLSKDKGFSYKFPQTYAEDMFNRIQSIFRNDTTKRHIDSVFIETFKGLHIYSEHDDAAIVRYSSPQIYIYAHTDTSEHTITLVPSPVSYKSEDITTDNPIYLESLNIFEHNYSQSVTENIGSSSDSYYIQGHAGLKLQIDFGSIDTWKDSVAVINSAQLILPIQNTDNDSYPYPPALNLRIYNEQNELELATVSVDFDSTQYVFNCHTFISDLQNSNKSASSYKYEIVVPDNNVYGNRVVIDGTYTKDIQLITTYTK
ncbi:MAG: hypothetical protein R6U95_02230 [Bacteroidales bacterium]